MTNSDLNDEISIKISKLSDSLLEVSHAYGFGYVLSMLETVCKTRLDDDAKKVFIEHIDYHLMMNGAKK
jgi:hypothetical protein